MVGTNLVRVQGGGLEVTTVDECVGYGGINSEGGMEVGKKGVSTGVDGHARTSSLLFGAITQPRPCACKIRFVCRTIAHDFSVSFVDDGNLPVSYSNSLPAPWESASPPTLSIGSLAGTRTIKRKIKMTQVID